MKQTIDTSQRTVNLLGGVGDPSTAGWADFNKYNTVCAKIDSTEVVRLYLLSFTKIKLKGSKKYYEYKFC